MVQDASPRAAPQAAGSARDAVIEFADVRIGFDAGEILRGITFAVHSRETRVLLGESGSGKTLILKLAAGLLSPDSGKIRIMGQEIEGMAERELLQFRRKIGFVFQEGALFDSLTVGENVAFPLEEQGAGSGIEPRVREALRFVEMEDAYDKLPAELSGGMRRRVSIARALVTEPPIVFYDSPTGGLDPVTSQTIISLILRLRDSQGVTSLLATHRLQDAFGLSRFHFDSGSGRVIASAANGSRAQAATNLLVLREGQVYFQGSVESILDSPDPYLKSFVLSASEDKRR